MVLCLPVADGSGGGTIKSKKEKATKSAGAAWQTRLSVRPLAILPFIPPLCANLYIQQLLLSHTLTALLSTPLLTILTILLGAPITSHLPHTFLLSLHIALLTTPPLFYTRGVDGNAWRQILSVTAPWDETLGAVVGAVVGAWLGAIPIPLDWDRVWQRWPVTPLVGAVGGWAVGRVVVIGESVLGGAGGRAGVS